MPKTLLQTLYAAFCAILSAAPLEGGSVMLIGLRNAMMGAQKKLVPYIRVTGANWTTNGYVFKLGSFISDDVGIKITYGDISGASRFVLTWPGTGYIYGVLTDYRCLFAGSWNYWTKLGWEFSGKRTMKFNYMNDRKLSFDDVVVVNRLSGQKEGQGTNCFGFGGDPSQSIQAGYCYNGKIYDAEITHNDEIIRHWVPYKDSQGRPALLDLITQNINYGSGTTTPEYGEEPPDAT